MAPAWSLIKGGAFPVPLRPSSTGLVQWTRSDVGLTISPATRVAAWADQSGHGQDWQQTGGNPGNAPYVLGDDIDGNPLITFGVGGDANKSFNTAAQFTDRFGSPMDGAHARSVLAVLKPIFSGAYNRTGGPVWSANSWWSEFFLDPTGIFGPVNGAYAWVDNNGSWGDANQFTPVVSGGAGPYDSVPTLAEYFSPGRPALGFKINDVDVPLAPLTMHGAAGPASAAQLSDSSSLAFLGGLTEVLVYDFDLRTDATAYAKTLAYLASRYPSIFP